MSHNIDENKLLEDLKKYRDQKGYDGLFGLIAKLAPEKVDKEDLENYGNLAPSMTNDMMPISTSHLEQFRMPSSNVAPVKEASIYAEEHIPAVQEDLKEQKEMEQNINHATKDGSKVRTLATENAHAPNPWQDVEVVEPGQLKLK